MITGLRDFAATLSHVASRLRPTFFFHQYKIIYDFVHKKVFRKKKFLKNLCSLKKFFSYLVIVYVSFNSIFRSSKCKLRNSPSTAALNS